MAGELDALPWGATGLTEAEQRVVRGGVAVRSRAACIRLAMQNYTVAIRKGVPRSFARQTLLNAIRNCNNGYGQP